MTEPVETALPIEVVSHPNLAAALAAVQAVIPPLPKTTTAEVKNREGKFLYSYQYADLADVTPMILPLLGRNGLAFTARPTMHETFGFVLHYSLVHADSEQTIEGFYPLRDSDSPQAIGGAITYGRRYTLCAVTGLAPGGDDDDAAAATAEAAASPPQERPVPAANVPVAKTNWAVQILDANTIDELRAISKDVEAKEELGHRFNPRFVKHFTAMLAHYDLSEPPADVTVGKVLEVARDVMKARTLAGAEVVDTSEPVEGRVSDWDSREIPDDKASPPEDD